MLYCFNTKFYYYHKDKIKYGSISCKDKGLYKKCKYNNIYYYKKQWIMQIDNRNIYNPCINIYSKKLSSCWKPNIFYYNNSHNKLLNHIIPYFGVSVPFQLTYNKNYGHALWDDLYSVYTSLVQFGYSNYAFNLVIPSYKIYYNPPFLKDIYSVVEKFSKGNNIFLDKCNSALYFETLIVGSSHQCQRCITLDYSLKYSREYNITRRIRDRMYEVYDIHPSYKYPLEGIIVHNKRYNQYEISILKKIIDYYKKHKFLRLYYIDYRNITTFYKQLQLMSRINLYISGPGTGLLNFPFISDPGVVINIGHIHFGCPQYLEQYIMEGCPHFKALYYSPKKRMKKMNFSYLITLIEEGLKYVIQNKSIYAEKNNNLNDIGRLYVKICEEHKTVCEKLLKYYDWGYGKCRGIWAENVIYFPSLYNKIPELKSIVSSYNSSFNLGCNIGSGYSKQKQCSK